MDIAPSLAQECVQAFWDVVKADQAIEGMYPCVPAILVLLYFVFRVPLF